MIPIMFLFLARTIYFEKLTKIPFRSPTRDIYNDDDILREASSDTSEKLDPRRAAVD